MCLAALTIPWEAIKSKDVSVAEEVGHDIN